MPLPQAIDNHAAGQRVIRVSDPLGERSAALALLHVVIAKPAFSPFTQRNVPGEAGSRGDSGRCGAVLLPLEVALDDAVEFRWFTKVGEFHFQTRLLAAELFQFFGHQQSTAWA